MKKKVKVKVHGVESMVDGFTDSTTRPLQVEMSALQLNDKNLTPSEDSEPL